MAGIKLGILIRELHAGNEEVVLFIWCVGTQDQPKK